MEVFASIFEKYGWGGLIGLIICIGIFFGAKWLSKKLSNDVSNNMEKIGEKLTNQLSKQNDNLVNVIVTQQDKLFNHLIDSKYKDQERHTDMMIDKINLSGEIIQALKTIMYTHNSQRAFILEFHNSYQNLTGIPFAKYSCTYEWFDKGMTSIANKCIGLPFSQIATIVGSILKTPNQQQVCDNMNELEDTNPSLFQLIKDINIKKIIYTAMFDSNNVPIGILVLEYTKEHEMKKEDLNLLKIQTAELTSVINIRYKYTNTTGEKNIVPSGNII